MTRRLLLGVVTLGAGAFLGGCMARMAVDAPPKSVVFFTAFSADLDNLARQVVNSIATDAVANPARTVIIEGFADKIGSASANQTLSQLRAQVVSDALVAHGVNKQKIVIRPRGATMADPGIESRRVDISFGS